MNLTPQFFLIADTHFFHDAILHLGHRPKDFEELIVENWNKVVDKHDKVLHLGDLVLDNKEKAISICRRLKGEKYLIRGNHDEHSVSWFKDCGFTVVEPIYKVFKDKYEHRIPVIFTHEPIQDLPKGWFNIHGHMHSHTHRDFSFQTERHYDVGVDLNNFMPIPLYEILNRFFRLI